MEEREEKMGHMRGRERERQQFNEKPHEIPSNCMGQTFVKHTLRDSSLCETH